MLKSNLGSNKEVKKVKAMIARKKMLQTGEILFLKKTTQKKA